MTAPGNSPTRGMSGMIPSNLVKLLATLLLAATLGCATVPPDPMWVRQRDGVAMMPDPDKRMSAYVTLAESAAAQGDAPAVEMILTEVEADGRHDDACRRCALALAARDHAAARRVARRMKDGPLRATTLDKIETTEVARDEKK